MAVLPLHDMRAYLGQGRLLGLDLGTKTIGVALSDTSWMIASPLQTITRLKFRDDLKTLEGMMQSHKAVGLILGLPVNMDGTEGPRCQSVRQFAENVLSAHDVPISFWDERLSTFAVTRVMLAADLSRKRRDVLVDKLAASYILQGALDCLSRPSLER